MMLAHFGATREQVLQHVGRQLVARGFKWANHGREWVLGHVVPLGLAGDDNEMRRLCLLSNTQVLTPEENQAKAKDDRHLIRKAKQV